MMKLILALLLGFVSVTAASAQSAIFSQVHNAAGWQPSTPYTYSAGPPSGHFVRVNNGPGWTPAFGGIYISGQAVNNYQLLNTTSPCTSATSGGPTTTASDILDGTCHWKYVGPVDYVSISGWTLDAGKLWASGTIYRYGELVNTSDANTPAYQLTSPGCTSTVKPTGTNVGGVPIDGIALFTGLGTSDGCYWIYRGNINYTSRAHAGGPTNLFYGDHFNGYITAGNVAVATASVSSNTLFVTKPTTSGVFFNGQSISGPGIAPAQQIGHRLFDYSGGSGYSLIVSQADTGPTTITSAGYGVVAITTPPVTAQLDATNPDVLYADPGVGMLPNTFVGLDGQIDGTHWALTQNQALCSSGSPCVLYHSVLDLGLIDNKDNVYHAVLWNDREYVSGQNLETSPIAVRYHSYRYDDAQQYVFTPDPSGTAADFYGLPVFIEAAAGEGFADTYAANSGLALAGYNANYGVAIRGVGVEGISLIDNILDFKGLQITSSNTYALFSPSRAANKIQVEESILESGSGAYAISNCGYFCFFWNNLLIAHATTQALHYDYGGRTMNNTIVCPEGTCQAALSNTHDWANQSGMTISGNAIFGFQHLVSTNFYGGGPTDLTSTIQGIKNATDVPQTDGADFPNTQTTDGEWVLQFKTGFVLCAYMPGNVLTPSDCQTLNSVSPSAVFVSWPGNYKPNPSGPLVGGNAALGSWNWCPNGFETPLKYNGTGTLAGSGTGSNPVCLRNADGVDLFGNARPTSARYDIGAVQYGGLTPPTFTSGRFLFRR